MKKVLVTGGLGFIGSTLVDHLLTKENIKITVIDNNISESSSYEYCQPEVEYITDDVNNIFQWTHKIEPPDTIFHLAGFSRIQPSFENPITSFNANIMGTSTICEYARRYSSRVIYAGSSSFYAGPKLNPYAFSKWSGEEICLMYKEVYGLSTSIARFFNVFGPRQPWRGEYATVIGIFERQIKEKNPLTIYGDGEQRRDFTHVDDICSGLIAIDESKNTSIYNLGTGKNYSINEIANHIINLIGGEKEYLPQRPGEARETLADISKTVKEVNWEPKIDLFDYLNICMLEKIWVKDY